jgi:predicted Zn-dependent protease
MTEQQYLDALGEFGARLVADPAAGAATWADAWTLVGDAVAEHPRSAALWCVRGDLVLMGPEDGGPPIEEARRSFLRAVECDPDDGDAWQELAHCEDVVANDLQAAERAFRNAVRLGAGAEAVIGLARTLAQQGRRDDAIAALDAPELDVRLPPRLQDSIDQIRNGAWDPA